MFTQSEKRLLVRALAAMQAAQSRLKARAREPEFVPIYEKVEAELAALLMKVQALEPDLEVKHGKGKA